LEAGVVAASFGTVSTGFHRTPTTAMVLGLVNKQVSTAPIVFANAHPCSFVGGEKLSCSTGDWPKDKIGTIDLG
jgi:hypothetical protein